MKIDQTDKTSSRINISAILFSIVSLGAVYSFRVDLLPIWSIVDYIILILFAAIVFILPDFIASFYKNQKWYLSTEFLTIAVIVVMGLVGIVLDSRIVYYCSYLIAPIGLFLIVWEFKRLVLLKNVFPVAMGVLTMGFLLSILYFQGWHTPLFWEQIILGSAHIDVLFHTSLSNMIASLGYASNGLDGTPYLHYHWGSHALFAGLSRWMHISIISVYNIAFPIIFIPLFIKALFLATHRLNITKHGNKFYLTLGYGVLAFLYSIQAWGLTDTPALPLCSESFGLSIILCLFYTSTIIVFITSKSHNRYGFILYTFLILLMLFFLKISTGYVFFIGIAYLLLRTPLSRKEILLIAFGGLLIVSIVYLYIYPIPVNEIKTSPGNKLINYWAWSTGFITYFIGVIIFLVVLLKEIQPLTISNVYTSLKTRKYIDLEFLAIINIAGAMGGLWVVSNKNDVYPFFGVQLFISVVYIFYYSNKALGTLNLSPAKAKLIIAFIIFFSIISSTDIIHGASQSLRTGKAYKELTRDQSIMKELVIDLLGKNKILEKGKICIHIPPGEEWFYSSNPSDLEIFIISSISGIASVNNIPQSLLQSDINNFGISYYKNKPFNRDYDLKSTIVRAKSYGYEKLIVYCEKNDILEKQVYMLN